MDAIKKVWARVQAWAPMRAYQRYSKANGSLLAGGVAYFAFFSIFPAVALAFTVFGLVLRNNPEILDQIRDAINGQLPGFVQDGNGKNGIIPISAPSGAALSVTAIVGFVGLIWAGMGWLGALRSGIRQIFGTQDPGGNFALVLLRKFGVLLLLGVGVVVAAAVNTIANAVASTFASWIGIGDQAWVVTVVGLLASVLANTLLVALMLRVLSGVDLPWAGLRNGAIFGGVGMTIIQTFASRLIANATSNPLLASVAVAVGLLVFMNFISQVMLLSASWAANDLDSRNAAAATVSEGERRKLTEGPMTRSQAVAAGSAGAAAAGPGVGSVLPEDPAARAALGLPTFGRRDADRVSVAAGAVLGAGAMASVGLVGRLVRAGRGGR